MTAMRHLRSITTIGVICCWSASATAQQAKPVYPASDPTNSGGWVFVENISDEFEGDALDSGKWFVQGTDGVYRSNFIGRAPSQFSTDNVRLEDGKLMLQTRWEPDFAFHPEPDMSHSKDEKGRMRENITTAAVISKDKVHYSYMEIRCKPADASVTSAFWMTGGGAELDVFEFTARPAQRHKAHLESELWSSIHDWKNKGGKPTWTDKLQLDWRVADDFHTYAVDWNENYLKFYADGKEVRNVTREEVGEENWVITEPLTIWVDSETFPWHGVPVDTDLPVDYEIEYIRVWQRKSDTAPANTLGFEGPIHVTIDGKQDLQDWWIAPDSRPYFAITKEKSADGKSALRFTQSGPMAKKAVAFAPYGSLTADAGEHTVSLQVWKKPSSAISQIRLILEEPWLELKPFDLTEVDEGKWVTLTQEIRRPAKSGPKDRVRVVVSPNDVSGKSSTVYFDEISLRKTGS